MKLNTLNEEEKKIYLGGGCFWCTEAVLKMLPGVTSVKPGYAGGDTDNPTYYVVEEGDTNHVQVTEVIYDPTQVSLEKILDIFFTSHDPTSLNKQGADVGTQYRSAVYTEDETDLEIVEAYIQRIQKEYTEDIVTEFKLLTDTPQGKFYEAEDYHHDYFVNNPNQPYCQVVIAPKVDKVRNKLDK